MNESKETKESLEKSHTRLKQSQYHKTRRVLQTQRTDYSFHLRSIIVQVKLYTTLHQNASAAVSICSTQSCTINTLSQSKATKSKYTQSVASWISPAPTSSVYQE